ncbi:MAG: hypothetical protein JHC26_11775 [Thermofilum sp.]|jgi:hypothetical protein|uniref:hypothetical protein n=1 Tax=Thermofilum sp. TaxID=1961369 RepID=UPI0025845D62|nr:hypothetical protein [Thermofilum sp.]MCI4409762.1 hypothetical protein [Thermofilum sp.]
MSQKNHKPRTKIIRIDKRITTPVLNVPVKLFGYYTLYYAQVKVNGDLETEDDIRVTPRSPVILSASDLKITGVIKIKGKEGDIIDVYQVRSEEMLFPPQFFSSRTRWVFENGLWRAIFTQVSSNINGVTDVCYCYSPDIRECSCGAETGEEE